MTTLDTRMPVAARLARTPRCHRPPIARAAFVESSALMPGAPPREDALAAMVVRSTVTPRLIAARALHEVHAALADPSRPGALDGAATQPKSFPLREKCGLFLSVCTVLISVQFLLPRTL